MKYVNYAAVVLMIAGSFQSANAARVDKRERNQAHRIRQGVRSGQLTKEEANKLRDEQKAIQAKKKEMRSSDGHLDKSEKQELRKEQNAASKDIYTEKHDAETRSGVTPAQPKPMDVKPADAPASDVKQ